MGASLNSRFRPVVVLATVVAAAAHVPVIAPHLAEAPYMGALFILLAAACMALAMTLTFHDGALVCALSGRLCPMTTPIRAGIRDESEVKCRPDSKE